MNSIVDIKGRAAQAAEAKRQPHIVIITIIIVIIIIIIIIIVIVIVFHADDDKCRQCWKAGGQAREAGPLPGPNLPPPATAKANSDPQPSKKTLQKNSENSSKLLTNPERS